jgi:site-specific DNA-methyltransferase (adenine-specific)
MLVRNNIYLGDCLDIMKEVDDKSIDLILTDPPYGATAQKWDAIIPFAPMWEQYERIIKDDGIICIFGTQPFFSALVASNFPLFRHSMIWKKDGPTGFLNANYKPLSIYEEIAVFSRGTVGSLSKNPIKYNPQGIVAVNKTKKNNPNSKWRKNKGYAETGNILNSDKEYEQKYTNYPTNILEFARDKNCLHTTQKPVALCEYLIQTFSDPGDLVLDSCAGSGTTGVAALNVGRDFLLIEKDDKYFEMAKERINEAKNGK